MRRDKRMIDGKTKTNQKETSIQTRKIRLLQYLADRYNNKKKAYMRAYRLARPRKYTGCVCVGKNEDGCEAKTSIQTFIKHLNKSL
jgi:hypothetical protein